MANEARRERADERGVADGDARRPAPVGYRATCGGVACRGPSRRGGFESISRRWATSNGSSESSTARKVAHYALTVQPRIHEPEPQAEAIAVPEALHVRRMRDVLRRRRQVDVVGLVRQVPLDIVDGLLPPPRVHLPPLGPDHPVHPALA